MTATLLHSESGRFFMALTMTLLLHGLFVLSEQLQQRGSSVRSVREQVTHLSFRTAPTPKSVSAPVQPPRPETRQQPPEPQLSEPEPIPARSEPIKKVVADVGSKVSSQSEPESTTDSEPPKEEQGDTETAEPSSATATVAPTAAQKADYLGRLMAHIEQHKYYPRAARRRGIEGNIPVHFQLLAQGAVDRVHCDGQAVLAKAACAAINAAQPLPSPPAGFPLPYAIAFDIRFNLN